MIFNDKVFITKPDKKDDKLDPLLEWLEEQEQIDLPTFDDIEDFINTGQVG